MMKDYCIRREVAAEHHQVENLVREAFWNVYRPGCLEHYVLHCLRNDEAFIPELDLVMTIKENEKEVLIGQIMCMHAEIAMDNGDKLPIMTLGPIGIHPHFQRKGYGKVLLDHTLKETQKMGFGAVCIEGNIAFYGKSGFRCASDFGLRYHDIPVGEDAPFFLCKELQSGYLNGVTGEYTPPQGYFVDEAACEQFDALFPPKEKCRLEGQLW